ncbi:MAG: hypothetical protein RIR62_113 [Pseudomonadota bacterium]
MAMKRMIAGLAAALALVLMAGTTPAAEAQERVTLGWGRLLTNDIIGDGRDRWRTGSYTLSRVRGVDWTGTLPATPGEILEFRFRGEVISPADLVTPDPADRRYAGALSFGLHTHFATAGLENSVGLDVVVTGPQTRLGNLHRDLHDMLGMPDVAVLGNQIGNAAHPTLVAETARTLTMGQMRLRPFAELQAGAETLVRIGGDLEFGGASRGALMLRDGVTGQRYRAVAGDRAPGFSLSLGGDMAHVFDSAYFPAGGAATLSDSRSRLRAGLHWQGSASEVFYGVTWLGREFEQQDEGQVLGSVSLRLNF